MRVVSNDKRVQTDKLAGGFLRERFAMRRTNERSAPQIRKFRFPDSDPLFALAWNVPMSELNCILCDPIESFRGATAPEETVAKRFRGSHKMSLVYS